MLFRSMSPALQALAFLVGANSIFYGEKLLTTGNPERDADRALLESLGLRLVEQAAAEASAGPAADG